MHIFRYPVSCFSFALLEKMLFDPLFNITDLNSVLYKRARGLNRVRLARLQLYYIKDFIFSCRFANRLVYYIISYTKVYLVIFLRKDVENHWGQSSIRPVNFWAF